MDNQHRKITGYRDLSQEEIDLMNRIKAKGGELLALHGELLTLLKKQEMAKFNAVDHAKTSDQAAIEQFELDRFGMAEPFRWAAIGKTDIQTAIMALVRAVAQPAGV